MHPSTYYHATATEPFPRAPQLTERITADVCVVGGGYTGLSAALHLARRGASVVLLEESRIGDGASGRNGGQVHNGFRHEPPWFESRLGTDFARQIWSLGIEAREHLDWLIRTYNIDAQYLPGLLHLCHKRSYVEETRAHVDDIMSRYPDSGLRFVDQDEARNLVNSDGYYGGYLDSQSGHLHALNLALGIARAAGQHGARLYEQSAVTRITRVSSPTSGWEVETATGSVRAQNVILAGNGYLRNLQPTVEARVMPINNFVVATEPLGRVAAEQLIRDRLAISDTRFVVYYFRITPDDRLLFGGGETYSYQYPKDIAGMVRGHLLRVFPQLNNTRIEYAWGGTLAVTTSRLPFVREIEPGLFNASGFSGQGIVVAPFAGKALADAIGGDRRACNLLEQFPVRRFPGGRYLRWPVLVAAMSWFALRDHL
ncbi:MAG TPA: FAD-binding oxidoreductase [Steroidobacteraceae bacterium]|nr:FAD-binding oxidoreductase [Steroidobacteraceae bacterium]